MSSHRVRCVLQSQGAAGSKSNRSADIIGISWVPTMGQLLLTYRSFAYRGVEDEQIAQELHHNRGELCSSYERVGAHTVQEALRDYSARQLRLAFMLQSWNAKMDFKKDLISDVRTKEETFDVSDLTGLNHIQGSTDIPELLFQC